MASFIFDTINNELHHLILEHLNINELKSGHEKIKREGRGGEARNNPQGANIP